MKSRRQYYRLLDLNARKTSAAYTRAIGDMATATTLTDLTDQIEAQDVDGVMEALNFTPAYLGAVTAAITATYTLGGTETAATFPRVTLPRGLRAKIKFDLSNPRAEAELRGMSGGLIREITAGQRLLIQTALADGFTLGEGPRATGLRIVGRIDRRTKRRNGGLIGLTDAQGKYATKALTELRTGDLRAYLTRELRDRRFDATIIRALLDKKPVPAKTIEGAVRSYNNRLLKMRANTIGRTETIGALNGGRDEAVKQLIDTGAIERENIKKIWDATGDARVRPTHAAADGQEADTEGFFTIGGARMEHPGDWRGPASERINCRCFMRTEIDFIAEAGG